MITAPDRRAVVRRFWFHVFLIGGAVLTHAPGHAQECPSNEGLAPGVRMPERVGCEARHRNPSRAKKPPSARAGREPGFIDVGNGLQVRIGGQADVEAGYRRR
jgi:hypothetical protein